MLDMPASSSVVCVGSSSGLLDPEAHDLALGLLVDHRVLGVPAPGRNVWNGARVRGLQQHDLRRSHLPHELGELDDRHRAEQPLRVKDLVMCGCVGHLTLLAASPVLTPRPPDPPPSWVAVSRGAYILPERPACQDWYVQR